MPHHTFIFPISNRRNTTLEQFRLSHRFPLHHLAMPTGVIYARDAMSASFISATTHSISPLILLVYSLKNDARQGIECYECIIRPLELPINESDTGRKFLAHFYRRLRFQYRIPFSRRQYSSIPIIDAGEFRRSSIDRSARFPILLPHGRHAKLILPHA